MAKGAKVYGLTGGISTGKSTVCAYFKELGVAVIDADHISRDICQPGKAAFYKIREVFGETVLTPEGKLDREKLAQIVFSDAVKRKQLEAITHPLIMEAIRHQIETLVKEGKKNILVEAALIFEAGYEKDFDGVIVVTCTPEQQLKRCMQKRRISMTEAKKWIQTQLSLEEKEKRAMVVIDNSQTPKQTQEKVKELLQKLSWR
ncbi:MAG: dephospho-CoA kinase [Deltaproteobacteria bacterium GWA2_38_16]|nr:MAG: dephospho-CoA kinase [Deltaproteobacteria bacterium GWA2_38_16]OGQ03872.1 MAG: dephospho-CoA kinase [Deltaproteobacteria bacterium RIFCSPHIGHO2_02_FULL_38_15]OGQ33338.1 MAG: dephospho-CoA kinase [Deltaproteobacteria bacterium RIFCSPLOWO2_01_FULL_38_9]HBQ20918.1 dephospho-CoA kinase [Deltaproteobacteria bacterium]